MPRRKLEKGELCIGAAAAVVACAIFARVLAKLGCFPVSLGLARTMLYIGLYMAWGFSVRNRVVQIQVRRYLSAVSYLMVFWFVVRSAKYFFVSDPAIVRYLWYLYYFPILFIPLFAVYVSLSLGKPERFRLPGWTSALCIPTGLCLLLVLTNDLHRLVFTFPAGRVWSDANNGYGCGYYVILIWTILCAMTAFAVMVIKCRLSQGRKYLPLFPLTLSIGYAMIYASGAPWMQVIGGDITAALCLLFTAILECCIQCGLIQANTGYGELFEAGTSDTLIVDREGRVYCASAGACLQPEKVLHRAESGTYRLDRNTLIKKSPIDGGYVLWQEDVSDIADLLEQLEENRANIAESNNLERENFQTMRRISALREKNRLYDLLQKRTVGQIDLLDQLLGQYQRETDREKRRSLLAGAAVAGAYVKRCGNLMFIGEGTEATSLGELALCLDESLANLELTGAVCGMDIPREGMVLTEDASRAYAFFEAVAEASMGELSAVWIKARSCGDHIALHMEAECGTDLAFLAGLSAAYDCENGVWSFTLQLRKAGEKA